jgi:hypothetical protein
MLFRLFLLALCLGMILLNSASHRRTSDPMDSFAIFSWSYLFQDIIIPAEGGDATYYYKYEPYKLRLPKGADVKHAQGIFI